MTNYRSLVPGGFYSSDPYDKTVPVAIRTNNPGAVNGATWLAAMPGYVTTDETTPGNKTTIFEAPEYGVAAWFELMRRYRDAGATTVSQIIDRYGGGQDYSAYVSFVASVSGLGRDAVVDLANDAVLIPFAKAMFRYEAGRATPLSDAQIRYGFTLRRGTAAPAATPSAGLWACLVGAVASLFSRGTAAKPAWYAEAERWIGFHETGVNRGIEKFIAGAKCGKLGDPWCAIGVNFCLETVGIRGTRNAMARSFEHDPNFVKLSGPAFGAIVTNWRGSPFGGEGHVFLYDGESDRGVRGIGFNEDDGVRRTFHPRNRVVGYYWPKSVKIPRIGKIAVSDDGSTSASSET